VGYRHVSATTDAGQAIERASAYLARDPVALNVIWSVMKQRADSGAPGRYWLLEEDGDVVGIVLESPPGHAAALAPMSREQAAFLAGAIAEEDHGLTGAVGEALAASAFAGYWSDRAQVAAEPEDAQRLFLLGNLIQRDDVSGSFRRAEVSERDLIIDWWSAFQAETGLPSGDVSPAVDLALETGRLFVWDDGAARCVARATEPLGGVSRIGAVYTPPESRRHGYAAACVGSLSAWLRRQEQSNPVLYAQLRNPGANAIYRRLGFRAVSETLSYRFVERAQGQ
jgi:GNAT superfamily N-acetyltransferase